MSGGWRCDGVPGEARKLKEKNIPRVVPRRRAIGGRLVPRNEGVIVVLGMREGRFTSANVVWKRTSSVVQTLELSCAFFHRLFHRRLMQFQL